MAFSSTSQSIAALRAQVIEATGIEEKVEVNQRHLIDKILARYSAKYTVFRELLQNANDAGKYSRAHVCMRIHFEGAEKAGLFGKEHCRRVQVRNNGRVFSNEDWHRLKKIAEGNPDEQKIGFFGVGFYSLFSICEGPFVTSGQECMAFLWKGDQLYTKRATVSTTADGQHDAAAAASAWTTFLLDMRDPLEIPNKEEFGRFLASSISFTANLLQVKMVVDGVAIHTIEKQMGVPRPISIRDLPGLQVKSPQKMFTLTGVDVQQVHFKSTCASAGGAGHEPKIVSVFARVARAHLQVKVTKQQVHDMERTTKKRPPSTTTVQTIYSGYEEHGVSELDKKSVFADLMPFPKQGQVYIGFPTHQTTGFSSHIAAHFIPTVERESIDFVDPCLASWNEDLLSMCGLLARVLYEDEMNTIANLYRELTGNATPSAPAHESEAAESVQAFLQQRASHAVQVFTYQASTPSALVGELGVHHFFASTGTRPPHILTDRGVLYAHEAKRANPKLAPFVTTIPVLPPPIVDTCKGFLDKLEMLGYLRTVDAQDVLRELQQRRLSAKELVALMQWWMGERQRQSADYRRVLLSRAVFPTSGRPLAEANYYVNPAIIPPTMPMPPQVIDYEITKPFKLHELASCFGPWTELSLPQWTEYIVNHRPELETDAAFTESVLATLSRAWTRQAAAAQQRMVQLLQTKRCIPTQRGHVLPTDAYFKNVTLFPDLPLISVGKGVTDTLLTALGVRKHVDLQMIFTRQRDLNWDHVQLAKFLASIQSTLTQKETERLRRTAFFPKEEGVNEDGTPKSPSSYYRANELYVPQDNLRQMGLPIIQWSTGKFRTYTDEGKLLVHLGLQSYPPLNDLLAIAAGEDEARSKLALTFLTGNFNSYYKDDYHADKITVAFLPCVGDGSVRARPADCFTNASCAIMGFHILQPAWCHYADKLGVRAFPQSDKLVLRLKERPPTSASEARAIFEFLASRQSELSRLHLKALGAMPFIPVETRTDDKTTMRLITPSSCYFSSGEQSQHGSFFDYVDYGSVANHFLRACGVRDEPSPKDLALMLTRSPKAFLEACGGYDPYLNVLRQLALHCDRLVTDASLMAKLRASPVLLGTKRAARKKPEPSASAKQDGKEESAPASTSNKDEPEAHDQLEYELARAADIYLIDDTVLQQIFSPLSAPMEIMLERFYETLGSTWLSKRVKETFIRRGTPSRTPIAVQLEALIKERAPLLFYDYQQGGDGSRILRDSQWLKKKLAVFEVPEIAIQLEFLPTKTIKTQPTSACVDASNGACRLYMTRVDFDHFDAANALGKVLFAKCRLNDALLLSTLLSSSMENLRRKGFPVDRILDMPKPQPTARAPSPPPPPPSSAAAAASKPASNLSPRLMEQYVQQLKTMFPNCDTDFLREQLAQESSRHVERVANRLAGMAYPEEKPRVISENDASETPRPTSDDRQRSHHRGSESSGSGSGLLGRLSRQLLGWQAPAPPQPPPATADTAREPLLANTASPQPPKQEVAAVDPNSTARLQSALKSAISSCRPYQSDTLRSEGQVRQVTESTVSYCDSIPSQNLQHIPRDQAPLNFYIDKSLEKATILADTRLMQSLGRFTTVLLLLCETFELDRSTVHIFYDKDGGTIAFNQLPTRALFFNLRYYDGLHYGRAVTAANGAVKEKCETYIYWFMTLCHELAHNFCREHNSQHEVSSR
ncbi:hypothetical protein SYNPS1DRAFT_14733 [Syncephalis pseudoplumigaleata]|uniref:Sacsin/Nov domain-containing protein n=1 Tax=Syncephalis pseudoplumigaleata TaxID=1712513 RepID=A0A4P9Z0T1_9FUNG|nr:hypothetical protein SYNPS1DRAFT_14733 [Syncephalis pseudoplumigaleata]|eukprot:RKP26067.1 hypothetical protein SYNPS1DRAFT_14733 [Syncephalis pseudoplumigaleata]